MEIISLVAGPASELEINADSTISELLSWRLRQALAGLLREDLDGDWSYSVLSFVDSNLQLLDNHSFHVMPGMGQLQLPRESQRGCLLQIALLFIAAGGKGKLTLELNAPVTAYLGSQEITFSGRVELRTTGALCKIICHDGKTVLTEKSYIRKGRHWLMESAAAALVGSVGFDVQIAHVGNPVVRNSFLGALTLADGDGERMSATVFEALQLIARSYPEGLQWVARVLDCLILVGSPHGSTSGSSYDHPGLVFVSYPISVDHLAVQIIHECSHQYLALHHAWRPLTDNDQDDLYYSPFKEVRRPLYNAMLALHAAVNMRLLISRLVETGYLTRYLMGERNALVEHIDSMLADVAESKGLTDSGRQLIHCLQIASAHD